MPAQLRGQRALYREIEAMDARGQVTQERAQAGKGWVLDRSYEQHTGRLTGILARAGTRTLSDGTLQHHLYAYDDLGNVTWREMNVGPGQGWREDFSYDALQRLTGSQVLVQGMPSSENISYDSTGNIIWRTGKGAYLYSRIRDGSCDSHAVAPGPHAVTQVDGMVLCYDANGNAVRRGTTQFVYDASNRVRTAIDAATNTKVGFDYGPGGERIRRLDYATSQATAPRIVTHEIGSAQIRYSIASLDSAQPDEVRRTVGHTLIVQSNQGTGYRLERQILLTDAQGSTQTVLGALTLEPVSNAMPTGFDAWGLRRTVASAGLTPTLWSPQFQLDLEHSTTRGYTGHEMAESVGIIHMNGRIYDPALGRFLQADPFVQSPGNSQSWNRYTYVFNNPLVYTDPSGYISMGDALRMVAAIAITVYSGGAAAGAWSYFGATIAAGSAQAYAVMVVGGFAAGAVQTGSLKGAVTGAVSAGAFYGIGSYFQAAGWAQASGANSAFGSGMTWSGYAAKALSHGAAGGLMTKLQGGRFGHGFASAGFSETVSPAVANIKSIPTQAIVVTVVGGTASSLAGGKFANGAVTSAFGYSFNHLQHRSPQKQSYGISAEQRELAAAGDVEGFWESRRTTGDPMAEIGLASLKPSKGLAGYLFGGASINNRLQAFSMVYTGNLVDFDAVRIDLMRAHVVAVDADTLGTIGLLNPRQVAIYHHQIFSTYGLPATAFGGTPMTGALWEASATRWIWCRGCD